MNRNDVIIRPATVIDAQGIAKVRHDAIRAISVSDYDQITLDEWAGNLESGVNKLLSNAADVRIIAEVNNQIVGYGELVTTQNLLGACYVLPAINGQGIGGMIVAALEDIARQHHLLHLEMENSANAESFYRRCGYQTLKHTQHIMKSGRTMPSVVMHKDL